MAKSFAARFRIEPGKRAHLGRLDPADVKAFPDRKAAEEQSVKDGDAIDKLQDRLYAEGKRAVLVVLQGTDTAGKDGTIKHVFKETGALGVVVTSFKKPSEEELGHDFLWRAHIAAPRRGFIGIFNRSHYEDVLIVRVHKLVPKSVWSRRYEQINAFERILAGNGVTVLKFFLHISKQEQLERLRARLDDPSKLWKFNPDDLKERKLWKQYAAAYEDALSRCSTEAAPWFIIPANKKWMRNLAVSQILLETLERLKPKFPRPRIDPKSFKL